jgi:hypothetical protein
VSRERTALGAYGMLDHINDCGRSRHMNEKRVLISTSVVL